jgi:hypothetical protein
MRKSSHIIRMMIFVRNGQWSSRELHSTCLLTISVRFFLLLLFSRFSFFCLALSCHNYSNSSYFSLHRGKRDVTDLFFSIYAGRDGRKSVVWLDIIVQCVIISFLYIFITLEHDTLWFDVVFFFALVSCWSMHLQLAIHSLSLAVWSVCLNLNIILVMRQWVGQVLVLFTFWLTSRSNFFKCRHSEIWVERVESNLNWLSLAS